MNEPKGKARGGIARAKALSPDKRRGIAAKAAAARWEIPKAIYEGELELAGMQIPCAVLADGTRLLTQQGFYRAIGRSGSPAKGWGSDVEKVAPFLSLDNLNPYVSDELANSSKPVVFNTVRGGRAFGYRAELLPKVCEVYLRARDDGALLKPQEKFARACDVLVRGLAQVGIVALVDEATGYQDVRDRQALQAILEQFVAKELAAWAKRFPDEFYKEIFRLRNWTRREGTARPGAVAQYTKDLVYDRLAPGLLAELERVNPAHNGRRRTKHHQWLTEDVGHPALAQHLHAVIGFMRASDTWDQFLQLLNRAYPRRGDTLPLPFGVET